MSRERIDRYIFNGIKDQKMKVIFQEIMKYIYSVNDIAVKALDKVENPLNVNDLLQGVDKQIAEKMGAINAFVNEKLKPYVARMDAIELLLRQRDNSIIFDRVDALENMFEKVSEVPTQDNSDLIDRINKIEVAMLEMCDKETTSEQEKKTTTKKKTSNKKETKVKKSIGEGFKKIKKK